MQAATLNNKIGPIGRLVNVIKRSVDGRAPKLLYLYQHIAGQEIKEQQYIGRLVVPLAQIQGSIMAGRCRDFDGNFRLLNKRGQGRLEEVARAWRRKKLPPISLVQVGDIFFVQDGHHRVAISIANGQESITANVTAMRVGKPIAC